MIARGRHRSGYNVHKPSGRIGGAGFRGAFFRRGAVLRRARKASSSFTGARLSFGLFLRRRLVAFFKSSPDQLMRTYHSENDAAFIDRITMAISGAAGLLRRRILLLLAITL